MRRPKRRATTVRRTVGPRHHARLTVLGEEDSPFASNTVLLVATQPLFDTINISLNRSETRALRDALTRILGDES